MRRAQRFPPQPSAVAAARRFAAEVLSGRDPELIEAGQLMISELTTNCVRHAEGGFEVTIALSGEEVRVDVRDYSPGQPAMQSPRTDAPSGRGLRIVDVLSRRWGVRHEAAGKTVWFTLADPSRTPTPGPNPPR